MDQPTKYLYKFEYYEALDDDTYVDWVWLEESEVSEYRSSYEKVSVRRATQEESELYNEAYADGYGIAAFIEYQTHDDGITYRIEIDGEGGLKSGEKMFECAICSKHKDFQTEVAMINGLYLTELKNEVLWHVCYDCVMIQSEVEGINIDNLEED